MWKQDIEFQLASLQKINIHVVHVHLYKYTYMTLYNNYSISVEVHAFYTVDMNWWLHPINQIEVDLVILYSNQTLKGILNINLYCARKHNNAMWHIILMVINIHFQQLVAEI